MKKRRWLKGGYCTMNGDEIAGTEGDDNVRVAMALTAVNNACLLICLTNHVANQL